MSGLKGLHQCLLYINLTRKNIYTHISNCGWKTSVGGNAADQKRVRITTLWKSLCIPMPRNSNKTFWGYVGSDRGSALHLTGQPRTLNALCSGMLVLEATTTKIKQGYFLPPPRPEISMLSWQQSKESRGVWLLPFKETTGLKKSHLPKTPLNTFPQFQTLKNSTSLSLF